MRSRRTRRWHGPAAATGNTAYANRYRPAEPRNRGGIRAAPRPGAGPGCCAGCCSKCRPAAPWAGRARRSAARSHRGYTRRSHREPPRQSAMRWPAGGSCGLGQGALEEQAGGHQPGIVADLADQLDPGWETAVARRRDVPSRSFRRPGQSAGKSCAKNNRTPILPFSNTPDRWRVA